MSWLKQIPNPGLGLRCKRAFDVAASAAGLVATGPLIATLAGLELVFHGWPPFFTQARPGLHGRVFRMAKLRTMTNERGPDGELLPDAERLTRFGQLLRSTSLDELPELWHVLAGEMSLVGPRPLLVRYLERYTPEQMRRHEMPPGITGWAQVNGRNAQSWPERLAMDVWYVDHWSLALDAKILVQTMWKVVVRDGISAVGQATMVEFRGQA